MKKNIETPVVVFDHFEEMDIIVTSDLQVSEVNSGNIVSDAPGRQGIWD